MSVAASRIVETVRQRAQSVQNPRGSYNTLHVRRHDFLDFYKLNSFTLKDTVAEMVSVGSRTSTVFVATDETDRAIFKPLEDVYDVCYLDDFNHLLRGVNPNFGGIIEQIVLSRGRHFWGTFLSTFSSYIMRLRGYYYSLTSEEEDVFEGKLKRSYYFPKIRRDEMKLYRAVEQPFFEREYPIAWRNIDKGIGEIAWNGW